MLYPARFCWGNPEHLLRCGHEHSRGDRCLALSVTHDLFAEIASGASSADRCRFRRAMLPAITDLAPISVSLQRATGVAAPLAWRNWCSRPSNRCPGGGDEPHVTAPSAPDHDEEDVDGV